MPRRSRKLRVCKWIGTVGCVLIVAACLLSGWWTLRYRFTAGNGSHAVWILSGCILLELNGPVYAPESGLYLKREPSSQWHLFNFAHLPSVDELLPSYYWVALPFWFPFVVLLIPTLLLWRRDRRKPRPGSCRRCDYDLTGNTTGRCPECGTPCPRGD